MKATIWMTNNVTLIEGNNLLWWQATTLNEYLDMENMYKCGNYLGNQPSNIYVI